MLISGASGEQTRELKQVFLKHLPERIAAVEDNWRQLRQEGWEWSRLERLFQRLQDLAGSAGRYGLIQVSESAFSLETYFERFISGDGEPDEAQVREIDGLMANLRAVAEGLDTTEDGLLGGRRGGSVYYLRNRETLAPGLVGALEEKGCRVQRFGEGAAMAEAMAVRMPAVIVVDVELLAELQALVPCQQAKVDDCPPLVVISNSSDLEVRLKAVRAGAAAFFVTPVDAPEVAARIFEQVRGQEKAPFRVMVVDDDASQAEFAAAILIKAGMKTHEVTDPCRILEALDQFRPDLVLMDLYMPGADGMELTRVIRGQDEFLTLPIVFLSGEQDANKQLAALSVGGDDFIAKPIRPGILIATVRNRIERARALARKALEPSPRDPATGLYNRRFFFERLDTHLTDGHVRPKARGLIVAALRHKDKILSEIGIGQTDALLAEMGALLASRLEPQDIAARLGDHSFAVFAERPLDGDLEGLARDLAAAVAGARFEQEGLETRPELAVGLCMADEGGGDAAGLVNRAVQACDRALAAGGGLVRYRRSATAVDGRPGPGVPRRIGELLREGLDNDAFQVLYQPFVDVRHKETENYQILLRLVGDEGDRIPAARFMPVARKLGLAPEVDHWLLARALGVMDERRRLGVQTRLLITQTLDSLRRDDYPDWLREELRRRLLVGSGLILEFPLADLARELKQARAVLLDLKAMGIGVCVERFVPNDTAYKVLHYLGAEYVKVATKVVEADGGTLSHLCERVHGLGARVILPHMDDPRRIGEGWRMGADFIQGDQIHRPQEHPDFDFDEAGFQWP